MQDSRHWGPGAGEGGPFNPLNDDILSSEPLFTAGSRHSGASRLLLYRWPSEFIKQYFL